MAKHAIDFDNVSMEYDGVQVLNNINLYIRENEFMTLLGPSGCGKTTMLRLIAGFEQPSDGRILLFGQDMNGKPPYERQVNTVFQRYALFPHLNVAQNIAFGLKLKKLPKAQIEKKVNSMLKLVGLSGFGDRGISRLSGGQQQRVAIARAVVTRPALLLADEPTGNLDTSNTVSVMALLREIHESTGQTTLMITHNPELALQAQRVITLSDGRIVRDEVRP